MTPAAIGRARRLYKLAHNYADQVGRRIFNGHQSVRTKLSLTRRKTVRERSQSTSRLRRLEVTRMNAALEMATSP